LIELFKQGEIARTQRPITSVVNDSVPFWSSSATNAFRRRRKTILVQVRGFGNVTHSLQEVGIVLRMERTLYVEPGTGARMRFGQLCFIEN